MKDYFTVFGHWYHMECPISPRRIGHNERGKAYQVCYLCGAKRPKPMYVETATGHKVLID